MHVITVTRRTAATPEAIWRLWADGPNRTRWDDALERITLEGPFQSGATGIVKLRGQPERRFKVVQCEPPQAYTDRFFLRWVPRWTGLTPSARRTASVQ